MNFFVYILQSLTTNRLYIGQTNDLQDRFRRHNIGLVPSTRNERPWMLRHMEEYETRNEAIKRETYLKSLKSSKYILDKIIERK